VSIVSTLSVMRVASALRELSELILIVVGPAVRSIPLWHAHEHLVSYHNYLEHG
jgi:hypothetical protein